MTHSHFKKIAFILILSLFITACGNKTTADQLPAKDARAEAITPYTNQASDKAQTKEKILNPDLITVDDVYLNNDMAELMSRHSAVIITARCISNEDNHIIWAKDSSLSYNESNDIKFVQIFNDGYRGYKLEGLRHENYLMKQNIFTGGFRFSLPDQDDSEDSEDSENIDNNPSAENNNSSSDNSLLTDSISIDTISENALSENMVSENTISDNTISEDIVSINTVSLDEASHKAIFQPMNMNYSVSNGDAQVILVYPDDYNYYVQQESYLPVYEDDLYSDSKAWIEGNILIITARMKTGESVIFRLSTDSLDLIDITYSNNDDTTTIYEITYEEPNDFEVRLLDDDLALKKYQIISAQINHNGYKEAYDYHVNPGRNVSFISLNDYHMYSDESCNDNSRLQQFTMGYRTMIYIAE